MSKRRLTGIRCSSCILDHDFALRIIFAVVETAKKGCYNGGLGLAGHLKKIRHRANSGASSTYQLPLRVIERQFAHGLYIRPPFLRFLKETSSWEPCREVGH